MSQAKRKALVVWGGWDGHTPKLSAELFADWLQGQGFEVKVSDNLDAYKEDSVKDLSLIVPVWTMDQIKDDQAKGLISAVRGGVGLAGWHGCMCDSFRNNVEYQFMTGGQWVAHPGGRIAKFPVKIAKKDDPITKGIPDFVVPNSEQYYMHVDPGLDVLATTTFAGDQENIDWIKGVTMPVVWKKMWGQGRVFYASYGHTHEDFKVPEALEIMRRGMLWAAR